MCSRKEPQLWGKKCWVRSPRVSGAGAPGAETSLCICQVEKEKRRKFGHCLLMRMRNKMLGGWVNRSLEN